MTAVDLSLLIGALICVLINWRNPRGQLWIAAGALSYAVSTVAWRSGMPMAEIPTALCDAAICLAIYFVAKYRWELWIWRVFQISFAVSVLYLATNLGLASRIDHEMYATTLEVLNWVTLLIIGGTAALQGFSARGVASGSRGVIRGALGSVWHQRARPPLAKRTTQADR